MDKERKVVGMFQEDNGNYSSMRLMCVTSLVAAIGAAWLVMQDKGGDSGMMIFMIFMLGAYAPKLVQKFIEKHIGMSLNEGDKTIDVKGTDFNIDNENRGPAK